MWAGTHAVGVDETQLADRLAASFGGTEAERAAVVRAARDLSDSGRYAADTDRSLTVEIVVTELGDAPDGGPADRWNWWMGALDLAYGGGYGDHQVRRWRA